MTSLEYWREREQRQLEANLAEEAQYADRIKNDIDRLERSIDEQISRFYAKYALAEGISLAEAQRRVNDADIREYEVKAKYYVELARQDRENKNRANAYTYFSTHANEEMRLYNTMMKINRLEMLKAELGMSIDEEYRDIENTFYTILDKRTEDEFVRQAGILGETISHNAETVGNIVNASFHNATWRSRIGLERERLKNELNTLLLNGLIQGESSIELARRLRKSFAISKYEAERLMRTELARVQEDAQRSSYEQAGIVQFVFISTEDARVCSECASKDGQVFSVEDMMPGENCAPIHPNCRCSTAAWMDREELERELFGSAELTARREARLAERRKKAEQEPDFSKMDKKQLEQFIDENLKTSFKDLKGVNVEYLREAVKVINQFEKMRSGQTIEGLSVRFGSVPNGAYAKYDDKTKTLILKKTGSIQKYEEQLKNDNLRYHVKWKTDKDYHATDTYSGTIWHELGHAVDIEAGQAWSRKLSSTTALDEASVKVSVYAGNTQNVRVTKRSEAWAENFAAYMDGGKNKDRVPSEIAEMIEQSIRVNDDKKTSTSNTEELRAQMKEERDRANRANKSIFKRAVFKSPLDDNDVSFLDSLDRYATDTNITSSDGAYVSSNIHQVSSKNNIGKIVTLSSMDYVYVIELVDYLEYNILWKIPNDDNLNDAVSRRRSRK